MHELYELKEKLCKELKKYSDKELTKDSLELVDKLSHAAKNLDKIIEKYEEEEEGGSYGYNSYENAYRGGGRSSRASYNNGGSYARGRGRNARRDSMGRYSSANSYEGGYSRNAEAVEQLREMMMDAPNTEIRREYEKIIAHMEAGM